MNKVAVTTEGPYRVVWVNGIPSKRFHIKGNDNAYNDARDYAYKMLSAKGFIHLFPITKERMDELKADYDVIKYDCHTMFIQCSEDVNSEVYDVYTDEGNYVQSYRIPRID